jgi:hypothetical protein
LLTKWLAKKNIVEHWTEFINMFLMKNERNRENTNNEYFMVLLSANV